MSLKDYIIREDVYKRQELIEFGEKNFDYVLVDTPPTGAAIDAAVVGKNVDGAVTVSYTHLFCG